MAPTSASDVAGVVNSVNCVRVTSVVTDNMTANRTMWKSLEPRIRHKFFCGCASLTLNLDERDLVHN